MLSLLSEAPNYIKNSIVPMCFKKIYLHLRNLYNLCSKICISITMLSLLSEAPNYIKNSIVLMCFKNIYLHLRNLYNLCAYF